MHHDAAAAAAAARLACLPLPGPDRVWGVATETCQRARGSGGGEGSWAHPVACRVYRLNSPLALISPPQVSVCLPDWRMGFYSPGSSGGSHYLTVRGTPERRVCQFQISPDLSPLAQLHNSPVSSHLQFLHTRLLPSLKASWEMPQHARG